MESTTATKGTDMYPTAEDLDAQRRDFALASEHAAYHSMAKARIARGQPWNKGNAHRATEEELAYGIGGSTIGKRNAFRETARAIKSGLVIG
jgi:hypothetical protein